jgi:hypothetical protein
VLIKNTEEWASHLFKNAELGDERGTKRLIKISHQMVSNTGNSIVEASGSQACIEGAYRFLRNDKIEADDIATAGLSSLLPDLKQANTILALEDTSTLCYRHNVTKELGHTGAYKQSSSKELLTMPPIITSCKNRTQRQHHVMLNQR